MIGRMLFVGLNTKSRDVIQRLIQECHVGGVVLYSKNYQTYQEMIDLIRFIHGLAEKEHYSILIGIDQEGYRVNRLPKEIKNLKSPYAFHEDLNRIKKHGEIIATILADANINVNFAPVLDIKRFADHHPIGDRSFGSDAASIIKNTIPYIQEFQKRNVIPVVKHFPGHGATKINSHYFLPVIWNKKRLFLEDVLPFQEAIEYGVDMVMVGHFLIPKFSLFTPTTLSMKTIHYLREDLHFQGIIMTDDLAMGLLKLFNKKRLIKKAIHAGFNMIMIKYYEGFFADFKKLDMKRKIDLEQIQYSLDLIDKIIKKYHVTNQDPSASLDLSSINQEIEDLNQSVN